MRTAWLPLVLVLATPLAARGETIYAYLVGDSGAHRLLRFDSASPETIEQSIAVTGLSHEFVHVSLEFDPNGALLGFAYPSCQITCPPGPVYPIGLDPFNGTAVFMDWPDFPVFEIDVGDFDADPVTRELRLDGYPNRNLRFDLDSLETAEDVPFSVPGNYFAFAHLPPSGPGDGVETFAILGTVGGLQLARIGGSQGSPPASTGEVTLIGALTVAGDAQGFDIAASGAAFVSTVDYVATGSGGQLVSRFYAVDLTSGETEELGIFDVQGSYAYVSGIAVAPSGLGTVLEIPALSRLGLAAFALLVAGLAFSRVRARRHLSERRVDAG